MPEHSFVSVVSGGLVLVGVQAVVYNTWPPSTPYYGSAYIYTINSTSNIATPVATISGGFMSAFALSGTTALISSYSIDSYGSPRSRFGVSVFSIDIEKQKTVKVTHLTAQKPNYIFGAAIALSGSLALVSSSSYDPNRPEDASVYVFNIDIASRTATKIAELTASDSASKTGFGVSVALHGTLALVGAPYSTSESKGGAVYVFSIDLSDVAANGSATINGSATQVAKLTARDDTGDYSHEYVPFGRSVALYGNMAIVAAPVSRAGSAYVFLVSVINKTATQIAKLTPDAASSFSTSFGTSVALASNVVLVGAPAAADSLDSGFVYVFEIHEGNRTVVQVDKLTTTLVTKYAEKDALFGTSVSVSDTVALVNGKEQVYLYFGCEAFNDPCPPLGETIADLKPTTVRSSALSVAVSRNLALMGTCVYTIDKDDKTATQASTLTARDEDIGNGCSVALSGNMALVGACGGGTATGGSAYLFAIDSANGTSTELSKLNASDGATGDNFGISVALSDNLALVGADGSDAAYVFSINVASKGVSEVVKLTTHDPDIKAFGCCVALDGTLALVQSRTRVYVFSIDVSARNATRLLTTISAGLRYQAAPIALSGNLVLVGDTVYLVKQTVRGYVTKVIDLALASSYRHYFGYSVAISGTTALVGLGSYNSDSGFSIPGSVSLFSIDVEAKTATQLAKLTVSGNEPRLDNFGASVALDRGVALVVADLYKQTYLYVGCIEDELPATTMSPSTMITTVASPVTSAVAAAHSPASIVGGSIGGVILLAIVLLIFVKRMRHRHYRHIALLEMATFAQEDEEDEELLLPGARLPPHAATSMPARSNTPPDRPHIPPATPMLPLNDNRRYIAEDPAQFDVPRPAHWLCHEELAGCWVVEESEEVRTAVENLMNDTSDGPQARFRVTCVQRVENYRVWAAYTVHRRTLGLALAQERYSLPPSLALKSAHFSYPIGSALHADANEVFLFHAGARPNSIANTGFDVRYAYAGVGAGARYGRGVYFAESAQKADMYASSAAGPQVMLLTRVTLGRCERVRCPRWDAPFLPEVPRYSTSEMPIFYDSILADETSMPFREIVVGTNNCAYPELLVTYTRSRP